MMWPPIYTFVIPAPVVTLDPRRRQNRQTRRKARHGKQTFWDGYHGRISPKELRESGA